MHRICWVFCFLIIHSTAFGTGIDSAISHFKWQHKEQVLPEGIKMSVPEGFRYLQQQDSYALLKDLWHNEVHSGTVGMFLPEDVNPMSNQAWGVTVTYEPIREDVYTRIFDYEHLIAERRAERQHHMQVEWLLPPHYDMEHHALHYPWIYKKSAADKGIINYEVVLLTTRGQLCLNFFGDYDQLDEMMKYMPELITSIHMHSGLQKYSGAIGAMGLNGKPSLLDAIYNSWLFVAVMLFLVLFVYGMQYFHKRYTPSRPRIIVDASLN
ncbi:uncharacterized protein DUF2167 [Chitinophaga dinghuensis]|uniref:Uncharacterized protein DUF2167 n=1 Tax=Chitinophaga dinghuensis TaxID=1539050 RepID=A0A327WFP9_9BACT|nr:DUF2167 domain-containing protein [Chitinophaga dinghuensis]RAJ88196.1 uncharacterized protein DUF2167 [Chitinophaga dinghuensis]